MSSKKTSCKKNVDLKNLVVDLKTLVSTESDKPQTAPPLPKVANVPDGNFFHVNSKLLHMKSGELYRILWNGKSNGKLLGVTVRKDGESPDPNAQNFWAENLKQIPSATIADILEKKLATFYNEYKDITF